MYGSIPAPADVHGGDDCQAVVVLVKGYPGLFALGGPIEETGRLKYIDGCTDTGIILPVRQGDPCLNCLFFPAHTTQTAHTHPSHRVGLIVSGRGWCHTEGRAVEMSPGKVFVIPAGCLHSFHTSSEAMRIIVCHPDSDVGPTDELHQMKEATLIDGRPAR
jgi:quercetin dioxygenase-like cupin family protein